MTTSPDQKAADQPAERRYITDQCVGPYVWIWERLARSHGTPVVTGRRIDQLDRDHGQA